MTASDIHQALEGIAAAKSGNTLLGLKLLKDSAELPQLPEAKAWHGYCLAREKNDLRQGILLCNEAMQDKPNSSDIYLALGRLFILAGRRSSAVKTLQQGLMLDNNREIARLLNSIGIRKSPVFSFLARSSKVNVASGRLLSRIGLR